ncbi:MAG: hypothetical protein M3070_10730 [Actinomycetota bacterium]|nr:hypothetical protein [Actinomycetota bacterium]
MTTVTVLPSVGDSFVDARDDGRTLRVSWHVTQDVFVLSLWRDGTCTASFQLSRAEAPSLIASLTTSLAQRPSDMSYETLA